MEEILFRGQTRRKGEKCRLDGTPVESNWVYGGVLQGKSDHSIIYQTEPEIEKKVVYTDTLGQYIGLVDKDGTKIFEGDILEYKGKRYTVKYVPNLPYLTHHVCFLATRHNAAFCASALLYGTVVGNIYDNPELIDT